MTFYHVLVTNLDTGESRAQTIETTHPIAAQYAALRHAFTAWGWHRCQAPVPSAQEAAA